MLSKESGVQTYLPRTLVQLSAPLNYPGTQPSTTTSVIFEDPNNTQMEHPSWHEF